MANSRSGDSVLERCVRVLEAFDQHHPERSIAEIAEAASLPSSTAYRLVTDMVRVGFLEKRASGNVVIGRRAWELFNRTNPVETLRFRAHPILEGVHTSVQLFTSLAVPEFQDQELLFVDAFDRFGNARIHASHAGRMKLFDNSSGIAMLAYAPRGLQEEVLRGDLISPTTGKKFSAERLRRQLEFVRRNGYIKLTDGLVEENTAYAVPVLGPTMEVVAAISVVGRDEEVEDRIILAVLAAAGSALTQVETALSVPQMSAGTPS
ncbi:IclR family transcriptional regulator [Corynebacterium hadale]|uniref:IclR family transcriptional regulator n=1 Tax=Corynebacterium hadale TaxID=2026255 RepID=A0AB36RJH9_9CORY|nr:helix-turn-helix domain-containing protein [Corynebacterium hadale]PAT09790.1 IclR family transcriptional regulator [Corynebacterium hadale]